MPSASSFRLWCRWTAVTTLGEVLGFAVPAVVGGLLASRLGEASTIRATLVFGLAMIAAGGAEGAVLGASQSIVLHSYLPGLRLRKWIARTALGAMIAWFIGMTPSSLMGLGVDATTALAIGVSTAPFLLASMGVLQWTILRHHVPKAGWWILANALAWLAGIAFVFVAMALVDEGTPTAWVIGAATAGGLAMGATAAALSGLALVWLLAPRVSA